MRYSYVPTELFPLIVGVDNDGDTHALYDLPAPKRWALRVWVAGDHYEIVEQDIYQVRVCIGLDGDTCQPYAIVVPIDDKGEEEPLSSLVYYGVRSMIGVLDKLGFIPMLPAN
jgi:hypothetical protein